MEMEEKRKAITVTPNRLYQMVFFYIFFITPNESNDESQTFYTI